MRRQTTECAPCKLKGKEMIVTKPRNRPPGPKVVTQASARAPLGRRHHVGTSIIPIISAFLGGNPVCPSGTTGFRIESPKNGTYVLCSTLSITITGDSKTCNWTATGTGIKSIAVKGGILINTYLYSGSLTADLGLVSPLNNGGNVPEIGHIDICFTCPAGGTQCGPGSKPDCAGVCGGPSIKDCAGVCYDPTKGSAANITDCKGVCYKAGTYPPNVPDCKGVCFDSSKTPPNAPDCLGVCGGTATLDCKGVCGGPAYQDCSKTCITPCDNLVSSMARRSGASNGPKTVVFSIRKR